MAIVIGKEGGGGWDTPLEDLKTISLSGLFIGTLKAPAHTWRRELEAEIERGNLTWAEFNRVAADRGRWRNLIRGL